MSSFHCSHRVLMKRKKKNEKNVRLYLNILDLNDRFRGAYFATAVDASPFDVPEHVF